MSDVDNPAPSARSSSTVRIVVALIIGAAVFYALWIAQSSGREVTIRFGDQTIELGANPELGAVLDTAMADNPEDFAALLGARGYFDAVKLGAETLELGANPDFTLVLEKAVARIPDRVGTLLSTKGFYSVSSPDLVDALSRFDVAKEANRPVSLGLRRLLWNLDGVFDDADLLSAADARFMKALTAIDQPIRPDDENGGLIIELWKRGLERDSPLGLRLFNARVVPVRADETGGRLVYFCPGLNDTLGEKYVSIFPPGSPVTVEGVLTEDTRQRLDCDGSPTRLRDLFAMAPLVLGVDPTQYAVLAQSAEATEDGAIAATFEVQPSRHVPAPADTVAAN